MRNFVLVIITLSLLGVINTRLSVYAPDLLANQFPGNKIDYSVAAFGQVPTGKKIMGTVVVSEPLNGCDPIDVKMGENLVDLPFVLVYRGICTYVQKVRHVQQVGGKMAIIVDNMEESTFTMADDGNGFTIEIPAIIIQKSDGDILKEAILNSKDNQSEVQLVIKFEDYDQKTLHFSFFLSLQDLASSYDFIQQFQERALNVGVDYRSLTDQDYQPFYYTLTQNFDADEVNPDQDVYANCYTNGQYCLRHRSIVDEIIYQKCLYQREAHKWWSFNSQMADEYKQSMQVDFNHAQARESVFTQLAVNKYALEKCYNQSFIITSGIEPQYLQKNALLENEQLNFHAFNLTFTPAMALNHRVFHRAQNFKETPKDKDDYIDHIIFSICQVIPNPTDKCQVFINQRKKIENENYINEFPDIDDDDRPHQQSIWIIIGIVIFLLFVFLVFAYLFRRSIINEYNEKNKEIDKQVTEYVNLHKANQNIAAI